MSGKHLYHVPRGHPCSLCGYSAHSHRVEHTYKDNNGACSSCGLKESNHRIRTVERRRKHDNRSIYIGIDGEGQGGEKQRNEIHKYILLAAGNESGDQTWHVEHPNGLSTKSCLDFILSLPNRRAKIFSFAFNYDLTKILEDLPDEKLYLLFRPELRQRSAKFAKFGPWPIKWEGYKLNLQGTKFTVKQKDKRIVIWDIFKFFQAKFVSAIKDWKVGEEKLYKRLSAMKDKRGTEEFSQDGMEGIRRYCFEECKCIGELAHKLDDSHVKAGLKLKTYYGAGSSGTAILHKMDIRKKITPAPEEMREAIACSFFGGRFENSVIGAIREPLWSYDISSAYPYQITFLPCLLHGRWEHTKSNRDARKGRVALIRYTLNSRISVKDKQRLGIGNWGPFPFRTKDGSISFPETSGGGWIWRDEYLIGEKLFPNVQFKEAWVYHCECDCQPFDKIPEYYIFRLRIGKEGPGLTVKLAVNSVYGKLAQSVGNAMFTSWIWAGLITSGTRCQNLEMAALHKDMSNMLMIATDGIKTRERLITPVPIETDTGELLPDKDGILCSKPLGGWEEKEDKKGIFFARPGIYFPLNPTEDEMKEVKARGVGKGVILENWEKIVDSWETKGVDAKITIANITRFCGAKTSISKSANGYHRATLSSKRKGMPVYGQWINRKVEMSFDPRPKRQCVNKDGVTLRVRRFPEDLVRGEVYNAECTSMPYKRAIQSKEALEMKAATQELLEQPDCDLVEYGLDGLEVGI